MAEIRHFFCVFLACDGRFGVFFVVVCVEWGCGGCGRCVVVVGGFVFM